MIPDRVSSLVLAAMVPGIILISQLGTTAQASFTGNILKRLSGS